MTPTHEMAHRGPNLGGLLRLARLTVLARIDARFHEAGMEGWSHAHYPILQMLYEKPEGVRLTELAEKSMVTKQSMGELVDALVASGHVERVPDPLDRRARLVRFTAAGEAVALANRAAVLAVEADLGEIIGAGRIEQLKTLLREVIHAGA